MQNWPKPSRSLFYQTIVGRYGESHQSLPPNCIICSAPSSDSLLCLGRLRRCDIQWETKDSIETRSRLGVPRFRTEDVFGWRPGPQRCFEGLSVPHPKLIKRRMSLGWGTDTMKDAGRLVSDPSKQIWRYCILQPRFPLNAFFTRRYPRLTD